MLSGPRRTQAGSHLPKIRPDTRRGESRKRPTTGPCGELATHFMGLLVLMDRSTGILPVGVGLLSVVSGPLSVVSGSGRKGTHRRDAETRRNQPRMGRRCTPMAKPEF